MDEFAELERELMEEQNSSIYSSQQILNSLDQCEVIRADTHSTGGRKIIANTGKTIFFLPLFVGGLISVVVSLFVLFGYWDSEGETFPFCFALFFGSIILFLGFTSIKDSVGEMIIPDDYEKYVMAVYFNRRRRYIAEVKTIIDATNDDIIGNISFVKHISLSKSKIFCRYHPGEPGEYGSPTSNDFIVSHGRESIRLDENRWLSDERRIAIAEDWSEKLGVKIGDPLIR